MISIDTFTSAEEQAVRSIRSSEYTGPAHHACVTREELLLNDLEQFRRSAVQQISASLDEVIQNVAVNVLGRELSVPRAELLAMVQRELRRVKRESPVRLVVSPSHVGAVTTELPVIADATLEAGALALELRDGDNAERLPVRLSCAADRLVNPSVSSLHGEVARKMAN